VDVMHNYNNEGTRIELFGLYTEFKIGIFYTIQKSGGGKNNHKKGKRSSLSSKNYLPYSH
jgi:hypothetical protein